MSDSELRDLERNAKDWDSQLRLWYAQRRHGIMRDIVFPRPICVRLDPRVMEEWQLCEEGSWEDHGGPAAGQPKDADALVPVQHIYTILQRHRTKICLGSLREAIEAIWSATSSTLYLHITSKAKHRILDTIMAQIRSFGFDPNEDWLYREFCDYPGG